MEMAECQGTTKAEPNYDPYYNAAEDAYRLRKAMKGCGTDEDTIIDVLTNRNLCQRLQIAKTYKTTFGRDLIDDLKCELCGNFRKVIIAMMMPTAVYDAQELRRAMKGLGTDECCLIEILASRSNEDIQCIHESYTCLYGRNLERDVISDTSGMFRRVLVSLLTGNRDLGCEVDDLLAEQDAQCLYHAGEKKFGTDEEQFLSVLCTRNRTHLIRVFDEYQRITDKDIIDSIKSEMSGDLENVFVAVVKCVRNTPAYFAERLYKSMKGLGTDDDTLIRVMVSRCEIDMLPIRNEFKCMYGKSLYSFIKDDTSGHYRKVLLCLCGGED